MRLFTCLIVLAFFLPNLSIGAVLLSEDFDDWPDWKSGDGFTLPMYGGTTKYSVQDSGIEYYSGKVNSPGRNGGKSLKVYRNGSLWTGNDYAGPAFGIRARDLDPGLNNIQHLYIRWSMRVPTGWVFPSGQKMFRFNVSDSTRNGEIYFNFYDSGLRACPNSGGKDCFAENLAAYTDWRDGNWHSHELYINLATRTVTYWLDGKQTYNNTDFGSDTNMMSRATGKFGSMDRLQFLQHFPYGNSFSGSTHSNGWQYFEVDDFVIATTKAETDPSSLPAPPSGNVTAPPPVGLQIQTR